MRFNHFLLLTILVSVFSACEPEDQVQNTLLTTDALASQMIEEQAFANYFEALAIHDKELQIGIVAGGSLPSSAQIEEMAQNTTLASTIYRLNEFVNASTAATAYVNMKVAFDGIYPRLTELATTYSEEDIQLALETAVFSSRLQVPAEELIQIISQEYGIGQGRTTSCIYQFSQNWNSCDLSPGPGHEPDGEYEYSDMEMCLLENGISYWQDCCKQLTENIYKQCSK